MTTKPKFNKLMQNVLRKSKEDSSMDGKKSIILHDGSKESAKILRNFLPFWFNKDRQINNNMRAAFATSMGVFKDPKTKKKHSFPLVRKAEEKPQEDISKLRKAKSRAKKGTGNRPRSVSRIASVPKVNKDQVSKDKETEVVSNKKNRSVNPETNSEEQDYQEQRQKDVSNAMQVGGVLDDKAIAGARHLLVGYSQALKGLQDTKKPDSILESEPYVQKVDEYQDLIAENLVNAAASFVLFQQKQFLDTGLGVDLMGMLDEKFKGAANHRSYAIAAFKGLISRVGQYIEKNDDLSSFGTDIFSGSSPDSRKNYDFGVDFNQRFDKKSLIQAFKKAIFLPKDDENYGDFISGIFRDKNSDKIKITMNEIAMYPKKEPSKNNIKYLSEIMGNMLGIIPDAAVRGLVEVFKPIPYEIRNSEPGSAQRDQLEEKYAKFNHVMNTFSELFGTTSKKKPDVKNAFVTKAIPKIKEASAGKNMINKEILENVDPNDLLRMRKIMDDAVSKPGDFLDGTFMIKMATAMTNMREAAAKNPKSKFRNWLPDTKKDDIQFYEKMFDATMYMARQYHPGSANLARSAIDHAIYQKDQDLQRKQAMGERVDDKLLKQMEGYRDVLNLLESRLADPNSQMKDIYKQWKALSGANRANAYDTNARKEAMKHFGLELGARLGDKDITSPVDSNILETQNKIRKINDFFGNPDDIKHTVFDGDSFMSRISELRESDANTIDSMIDDFNKNTYADAEKTMGYIERASNVIGKPTEEILADIRKHKGYTFESLFAENPADMKKHVEAGIRAFELQRTNPGILGEKNEFSLPTDELKTLKNAYEKSKADEVKNVANNFQNLAGSFLSLRPTTNDYAEWQEDPTKAEHFMRDIISMHYGLERIRGILQDKPYDPLSRQYKQFMNETFLPKKDEFMAWAEGAGGDIDKLHREAVKYGGEGFMSEEHRKEIAEGDKKIHDKMKLEELKEMLNSKISQEMYEKQGLLRQGEFFKYVENKEGEPDLVLHRLTKDKKSGQIVEKKVSQREIKQRDEDFLTAIPQLAQHYNLSRGQRNLMRKFAQANRSLGKSKPHTVGYGRYNRIVNDTRKELEKFLPGEVISGLGDVSGMPFKALKQDALSEILGNMRGDKAKFKFTNSFIVDPYSNKVQGVESQDLIEIANQTSQDRNAYVVPETKEGQTTAISGLNLFIGNPDAPEEENVNLDTGVGPNQIRYMKDNQKLKTILSGQDTGDGMRSSEDIYNMQGPVDYRTLSNYGQRAPKFSLSKIPQAVKTGKGKAMEGIGDVVGRVFKEEDADWMEVIE